MGKKLMMLLATCSALLAAPALARADEHVTTIRFSQSTERESTRVEVEQWQPVVYYPDGSVDPGQRWQMVDQRDQSSSDGFWQQTDQSW
jgi:hypothetical protein